MLHFASDYMEGAHPAIIDRLIATNMVASAGYGGDEFSESARSLIREACSAPAAEIHFLAGGTQANAVVIGSLLAPYQAVIAPTSGHISTHEAGAIEATGHKVIELPEKAGKISAEQVAQCANTWEADANHDHMPMPGMVYISQPTEYGTLYSLAELEALAATCREHSLRLFVDGARLAYALAAPENDVTLADLARLTDVFYIGGTKCGALLGEAVVIPRLGLIPHLFTLIKRAGALLAKGRMLGIQFEQLFTDGLYARIGAVAIESATRLREGLLERGYELRFDSPTNQSFVVVDDDVLPRLDGEISYSFWEKAEPDPSTGAGRTVIRLATSWATNPDDVDALLAFFDREVGAE